MRHLWHYKPASTVSGMLHLFLWALTLVSALEYCPSGTHMFRHGSGDDICRLCERGKTFMSEENHKNRFCFTCSQVVRPEVEVVITECDLQHDTVIQCKDGYYRKKARNVRAKDECVLCSVCDHVTTRPCMNYTDAVCCFPNYDAVQISPNVFHCIERPILCGPGQFFSNKTEQCLPCPADTYMLHSNHNNTSCTKCAGLSHSSTFNSDIIQNCSPLAPTLFGCKEGYYITSHNMPVFIEVNCTKCDSCTETGILKPCSHFQNSVCKPLHMVNNIATVNKSEASEPYCCQRGHCVNVSSCQNLSAGSREVCPDLNVMSSISSSCPGIDSELKQKIIILLMSAFLSCIFNLICIIIISVRKSKRQRENKTLIISTERDHLNLIYL